MTIDFSADAAGAAPAAGDALNRLAKMAELMRLQARRVEDITDELSKAKADLQRIEREELPELLRELGMTLVKLEDGSTIELKDEVDCGITEANRGRAHAWLTEHGYGGLIKTEVSRSFGREEREKALELAEEIGGDLAEKVHPATLKSFVKERREAGEDLPADLFGIFPYSKAKLTAPKAAKARRA